MHANIRKANNGGYIIEVYDGGAHRTQSDIAKDWAEAVHVLTDLFAQPDQPPEKIDLLKQEAR